MAKKTTQVPGGDQLNTAFPSIVLARGNDQSGGPVTPETATKILNYHLAAGDRDYPLRSLHDHYCAYSTIEEARLHIEDAARNNVSSFGWWSISRLRNDGKMEDVEGGSVDCIDGKTVAFN